MRIRGPWDRSLRARLVGYFLLLSSITVAVVGVVVYARATDDLTRSVFERLDAVAEVKADSLDRWIDEQRRNVVFVGAIPGVGDQARVFLDPASTPADRDAARAFLTRTLSVVVQQTSDAQEFMILDLDGTVRLSTVSSHEGLTQSDEFFFRNGVSHTTVQNSYKSSLTGLPTITVSNPLFDADGKGRRVGVLAGNLNLERIDRIVLERTGLGEGGATYLVGLDHRFLHARLNQGANTNGVNSDGILQALAGNSGQALYTDYQGVPVIGVYRWLAEHGAALLVELPQAEAFAPAQQLALAIAIVGLVSALLLAIGIWLIARQVTRPILDLAATATAVAGGDLSATAPVRSQDEVGRLTGAFNDMTAQLRENVETLERRVAERTSELTEALEAQAAAEERYRSLVEELPLVVYVDAPNEESDSTYMSSRVESVFGYPYEQWLTPGFFSTVLHPDDVDRLRDYVSRNLDVGRVDERTSIEYRVIAADGRTVWVRDDHWIVREEDGTPRHVQGFMLDITAQKLAESELIAALEAQREAEQRYRRLVEELPLAVYMDPPDENLGASLYVSPPVEEMFGYPAEKWLEEGFFESIVHEDDREPVIEKIYRHDEQDHVTGEYRIIASDGRIVWVRDDNTLVREEDGNAAYQLGFIVDITAQHDAAEELHRQKVYFESLVEISPAAVVTMDRDERVTGWNPAAERLFGYTPAEAIGRTIDELIMSTDAMRAEGHGVASEALETGRSSRMSHRARKDRAEVDVEIVMVPLVVDGAHTGYYAVYHDVTELQAARREADAANQAKSSFLAAMSHEIRTPMNAIIGMSGLLLDTSLDDEQRDYADTIRGSGDALLTIINDILDFSKIEAGRVDLDAEPFDLRRAIEGALDVLAPTAAGKGIELAYQIDDALPPRIVGDSGRFRQIVLNLLSNAVKFTGSGEVELTATGQRMAGDDGTAAADDDRWELAIDVRDTGIGIPADHIGRLFQSFSQADASISRRFGGTGLGLVISRRLAEAMGGSLVAESAGIAGQGSTFRLRIVAPAAAAAASPVRVEPETGLAGRRALVVDDNATNRRILVAQLRRWEIETRDTALPAEALEWVRDGGVFDVVLSDLRMPGMDGLALAEAIRKGAADRAVPILILSSIGERMPPDAPISGSLTKPVKPSPLHDALVNVLSGREAASPSRAPDRPAIDATLASRHPLRLLLAEDNAVNQKLALRLLERMGYQADVAADGLQAIAALEGVDYDAILMDVQMPELDGLEATRRIRARWPDRAVRIIAMTANAMAEDREACLAAGMDDYVSKPIRVDELVAALERVTPAAV